MAEKFGANAKLAGQVSGELSNIRSNMKSMGDMFDRYDGATGSSRIEEALEEFFSESSDNREKMDGLLKRGAGLLRGLSDGVEAADAALVKNLQPKHGSKAAKSPSET